MTARRQTKPKKAPRKHVARKKAHQCAKARRARLCFDGIGRSPCRTGHRHHAIGPPRADALHERRANARAQAKSELQTFASALIAKRAQPCQVDIKIQWLIAPSFAQKHEHIPTPGPKGQGFDPVGRVTGQIAQTLIVSPHDDNRCTETGQTTRKGPTKRVFTAGNNGNPILETRHTEH